ncbi:MAG TPA: glycosyltransferase 87 family protein, partial [Solirubrobacterales bacterium]
RWPGATSAYGPLFTLGTYPLAWVPVDLAIAALKTVAALSVLGIAVLVARMAPARGVDPLRAAAFVALNPLVLVHVVGGAHNDATVMLAALAGCAAVVALLEGGGGAAVLVGAGLKLSAAFVAPFALLGSARHRRFLAGAGIAALAIAAAGLAAFGTHALDSAELVGENQGRVSNYSIPNLLSELLGVGIGPLRAVAVAALAALGVLLCRWVLRGGDWIRATGWAALGLLLASAWLLPWYMVWALPFAALSRDNWLLTATLALTALQLAARVPL